MPVEVGKKTKSGRYPIVEVRGGKTVGYSQTKSNAHAAVRVRNYEWAKKRRRG